MKNILLLHNPHAGTKQSFPWVEWTKEALSAQGWQVATQISQYKGFFTEYLANESLQGVNMIGVLGGDGTMHEVLNGLMKRAVFPAIPLILFPAGTGNAFNHDIGCLTMTDSLNRLEQGQIKEVDIFQIKTPHETILGFNVLGFGLVSQINATSERLRWMGGLRYSIAALPHIFKNPSFRAHVEVDGQIWEGDFCFVLVSNTIHTGKSMKMSPQALLDDGLFDVMIVPHVPFWHLLRLFPLIFSGKHITSSLLTYIKAKQIKINAKAMPLIIDGETKGATPVEIQVLPRQLKIIV